MIPSKTPSTPSHCFNTSSCIRFVHAAVEMKPEELAGPVVGKKLALQDCRLLKSRAGIPCYNAIEITRKQFSGFYSLTSIEGVSEKIGFSISLAIEKAG